MLSRAAFVDAAIVTVAASGASALRVTQWGSPRHQFW